VELKLYHRNGHSDIVGSYLDIIIQKPIFISFYSSGCQSASLICTHVPLAQFATRSRHYT